MKESRRSETLMRVTTQSVHVASGKNETWTIEGRRGADSTFRPVMVGQAAWDGPRGKGVQSEGATDTQVIRSKNVTIKNPFRFSRKGFQDSEPCLELVNNVRRQDV